MGAAARVGDKTSGHPEGPCFFPGRDITSGSSNVFINGIAAAYVGSDMEIHCCGSSCHGATVAEGSSNIFVNGKALARIGDKISCNGDDVIVKGSSNVFAN